MKLLIASTFAVPFFLTSAHVSSPHPQQQPLHAPATTSGRQLVQVPQLGYGTWNLLNATASVSLAIQLGYEHIDTAAAYGNQVEVGEGIKDGLLRTGKEREEIFVTGKLWNTQHSAGNVEAALDHTLKELGLNYLDLYLMHWPVEDVVGRKSIEFLDTWRGLEALIGTGKVKYIGISNFDLYQLSQLQVHSTIKPLLHQFELHPFLQQWDFLHYHQLLGISVIGYSPLGNLNPSYHLKDPTAPSVACASSRNHHQKGEDEKREMTQGDEEYPHPTPLHSILVDPTISAIAQKRDCTNAQVALSWGMGRGTSVIVKGQTPEHILENVKSVGCYLHEEDYDLIEAIEERYVKRFNKPGKAWGVRLFQGLDDPDDCRFD